MFSLRNKKKYFKNCPQYPFFHVSHNLELIHFTLHIDQFQDTCNIGTNKQKMFCWVHFWKKNVVTAKLKDISVLQ